MNIHEARFSFAEIKKKNVWGQPGSERGKRKEGREEGREGGIFCSRH